MRTTLNLEADVVEAARSLANQEQISLGEAVSRLVRRGLRPTHDEKTSSSETLPVFAVAEDAPVFGTDDVRRALTDD